jgi:transcription elongation factor S-II
MNDIPVFDPKQEYIKMFKFRTSGSNNIRTDVMEYAIKNLNRKDALFKLFDHISPAIAEKIENGLLEMTLINISNENSDVIEFCNMIYNDKLRDICLNLDSKNKIIGNKTLKPALLEGQLDPYFVAFMTPQQLHPERWHKELEKRRVAEVTSNNQKVTDIYRCRKCGDRKSITSQMQTRSADEPMTIFVTCLTCYNTFTTQ